MFAFYLYLVLLKPLKTWFQNKFLYNLEKKHILRYLYEECNIQKLS